MKYLLAVWAVTVLWCSQSHAQLEEVVAFDQCPERGTVVSDEPYCGGGLGRWTKWEDVANGQCGTFMRRVEDNAVECGYTPDEPVCPIRGTDLDIRYCGDPNGTFFTRGDPLTQYTRIANGTCGSWRRTLEIDALVCKPPEPPPEIDIEPVKTTGDRFRPVMFNIIQPQFGPRPEVVELNVEATLGIVRVTDTEVLVYGDGEIGEGTIVVNDEEWRYTIEVEPRCEGGYNLDCLNYSYNGPTRGFIYYGEDDTQMVEWELGVVHWVPARNEFGESELYEFWTEENNSAQWNRYQQQVENYNLMYARSGIHVRFVLKSLAAGYYGVSESGHGLQSLARKMGVDIAIGNGRTCPGTCGCAFPRQSFMEGGTPVTGVSVCGAATDLHELGHGMGLAHGPNNSSNASYGYIWGEFGHGDYAFCGQFDDIMSYGENRMAHHNSLNTCYEQFGDINGGLRIGEDEYDAPAGDREIADAVYHVNRIRYDISLIHTDRVEEVEQDLVNEPIVLDYIDDFANGRTLYNRGMRRHIQIQEMEN